MSAVFPGTTSSRVYTRISSCQFALAGHEQSPEERYEVCFPEGMERQLGRESPILHPVQLDPPITRKIVPSEVIGGAPAAPPTPTLEYAMSVRLAFYNVH